MSMPTSFHHCLTLVVMWVLLWPLHITIEKQPKDLTTSLLTKSRMIFINMWKNAISSVSWWMEVVWQNESSHMKCRVVLCQDSQRSFPTYWVAKFCAYEVMCICHKSESQSCSNKRVTCCGGYYIMLHLIIFFLFSVFLFWQTTWQRQCWHLQRHLFKCLSYYSRSTKHKNSKT